MRTLALVTLLAAAIPAAAGENDSGGAGLFSRAEDSPLTVAGGVWVTHGFSENRSATTNERVNQDLNLMAIAEVEFLVPGAPWLAVWGRGGQTVYNAKGDTDDAKDVDSDFTLAELNLGVTLAGRSSPLFENDNYPRSRVEAFVGARYFREEFTAELAGGIDREHQVTWVGPQAGLRGVWYLQDTYDYPELRGWSLSLRGAVMPWMQMKAEDRLDGTKAYEQNSDQAYGGDAALAVNWRRGPLTFSLGFEAQWLRADDGKQKDALDNETDLFAVRSNRYGGFLTIALSF
jgi:hypothetical protein